MNKYHFSIIFLSFLIFSNSIGQNTYPNKLEGCNTEQFALESDSVSARKSKSHLAELVSNNLDTGIRKKILGILKIQVIAYEDKSSCMMSYENATNVSDTELNIVKLKETIDSSLIWDEVEKSASPMIEFYFLIDKVKVKRIGVNGKKGFHELIE